MCMFFLSLHFNLINFRVRAINHGFVHSIDKVDYIDSDMLKEGAD